MNKKIGVLSLALLSTLLLNSSLTAMEKTLKPTVTTEQILIYEQELSNLFLFYRDKELLTELKHHIAYLFLFSKNNTGATSLHWAAQHCTKETIQFLIDLGLDITAQDNEGNTCLHYAAKHNTSEGIIQFFKSKGLMSNAENNNGVTPFTLLRDKCILNHINEFTSSKMQEWGLSVIKKD